MLLHGRIANNPQSSWGLVFNRLHRPPTESKETHLMWHLQQGGTEKEEEEAVFVMCRTPPLILPLPKGEYLPHNLAFSSNKCTLSRPLPPSRGGDVWKKEGASSWSSVAVDPCLCLLYMQPCEERHGAMLAPNLKSSWTDEQMFDKCTPEDLLRFICNYPP